MEKYKLTDKQITFISGEDVPVEAIEAYFDTYAVHSNEDVDSLIEDLCANYYGEYDSEEDFAQGLAKDTVFCFIGDRHIRDTVETYFDYESYARDIFVNDFGFYEYNGRGFVFNKF